MNIIRLLFTILICVPLLGACAGQPESTLEDTSSTPSPITQTLTPTPGPTTPLLSLSVPILKSPPNGSLTSSLTPILEWQPSAGDASYGLQVATDQSFSNLIIDTKGLKEASYVLPPLEMDYGKTYYWRVGAGNAGGKSGWSPSWSFVVQIKSTPTSTANTLSVTETQGGVETDQLIVRDTTGQIGSQRVRDVAIEAEKAVRQIIQFYSTSPVIQDKYGKILVLLYPPQNNPTYGEIYYAEYISPRNTGDGQTRAVLVYGAVKQPQEMVQKLAHAAFLSSPDKLIRNMMGIPMECQFGNMLSHPMSGFSNDAWVLALREVKSYIPLAQLGPDNESWGMTFEGERAIVFDIAKQQTSYAEAGSFGQYLLNTYGVQKVKAFQELSLQKERPWMEVFGLTLSELETNWIQSLDSIQTEEKDVSILVELIKRNPDTARFEAQRLRSKD